MSDDCDKPPTTDTRIRLDRLNLAIKAMRYVVDNGLQFDPTLYDDNPDPRLRCGDLISWLTSVDTGVSVSGFSLRNSEDRGLFPAYDLPDGRRYSYDDAFAAWMGMMMVCATWLLYPSYYSLNGAPDPENEMTAPMVLRRLEWLLDHPHAVDLGWDYFFEHLDVGVAGEANDGE